jgi:hypothetical protein
MIGYYVHHHGRGHLERARLIASQLREPVTALSSLSAPADWPGEWVELESDLPDEHAQAREPCAEGALHWAPLQHAGLRRRMAQIAAWVVDAEPRALVCDVSVEVAALARLMGIPVVSIALPGAREDAPHLLGYTLSSAIVAPWPEQMPRPDWPARWQEKTHTVGAFSRFDGRERIARVPDEDERTVTLLLGAGGDELTSADLLAASEATTGWSWKVLGPERWVEDPWPDLCRSDVVVTHAGQNCIAEVAAARAPAIVIPQPRPHDEQLATARVLQREGLATVCWEWPSAGAWPGLLDAARARGGERWAAWSSGTGARRAAQAIEALALRLPASIGARCALR